MVKAFEQASGRPIPYKVAPRRAGDIAQCWADPSLAHELLGWKTKRGLERMCSDAWRWQQHSQTSDEAECPLVSPLVSDSLFSLFSYLTFQHAVFSISEGGALDSVALDSVALDSVALDSVAIDSGLRRPHAFLLAIAARR